MTTTYEKVQPYIQSILEKYQEVQDSEDCPYDALQDFINQEVLEISVRCSTWSAPGEELIPDEFRVLLAWGGPSVEITGDIESERFEIVYKDWGTREELRSDQLSAEEQEAVEWFLSGIPFTYY